ncbi:MAG: arylamine N-acetyltransferase [Ilumatobacteraceae bacterium]
MSTAEQPAGTRSPAGGGDLVDAYLARLGLDDRPPPTAATLERLHRAHLGRVPFENLDIHIGRPITIDVDRFVTKIVNDRRGGFCYELNGAFAWLLERLGFAVDRLEARVHGDDGPSRPFDHLCLRVTAPGDEPALADVGFGDSFDAPIPLTFGVDHVDSNGVVRLERVDDGWIDLCGTDGPVYRAALAARPLGDFAPGCAFHQSPESHFTKNTICSIRTATGRVTLRGLTLVRTVDGERRQETITGYDLVDVLAAEFGVHLPAADLDRLRVASRA